MRLERFVQRGKAMAHPKLDKIEKMLEKGKDFELSNEQYKTKTGADFPKNKYYAEKNSAVARRAKEYGYSLEIIPQRILFKRKSN